MPALDFRAVLTPHRAVPPVTLGLLAVAQAALVLMLWSHLSLETLPTLADIARAFSTLWLEQGLGPALGVSVVTSLEALVISTLVSCVLAWATVIPVLRPVALAVTKGRFLGLAGLTFIFMLTLGGGQPLRLALLVFGLTVFLTTSMVAEVAAIPRAKIEHARTLRMSEWRAVWEVVVLGTAERALELVRQNAAIGWTLLTTVEGLTRAEGGVGTMLLDQNKHLHLPEVFALQATILVFGLVQDALLGGLRRVLCPYSSLRGAHS